MTSHQLGHRAASHGAPREAPIGGDPNAWLDAYDAVMAHNKLGLDPKGHPPRIPHLCARDVTKVCNCCDGCQTTCWAEKFEGATERLQRQVASARDVVKGLLRKVIGR